jgi:hypothetical protein
LPLSLDDLDSVAAIHAPHLLVGPPAAMGNMGMQPSTPLPMLPPTRSASPVAQGEAPQPAETAPATQPAPAIPALQNPTRSESNAAGRQEFQAGMPTVTDEPGTPGFYAQKEEINQYKQAHPWGSPVSEHPGFLGKVGHALGEAANIAGDVFAPQITSLIPGSQLNEKLQSAQNQRGMTAATGNEEKEAQAGNLDAETAKNIEETKEMPGKAAEASKLDDARVTALLHPEAKTAFEAWREQNPTAPVEKFLAAQQDAKPDKPASEQDKEVSDYEQAHGLPDTPANRDKARDTIKTRDKTPRQPTDREEWMKDHPGESIDNFWKAKAGAGGAAKAEAGEESGKAAQAYADDYLKSGKFTGAGDEALMEKYFELAKPSSGFRMTQPQIEMLTKAQDLMNSVVAKGKHLFSPEAPYFSPELRSQIVETMKNLQKARDEVKPQAGGKVSAATAGGKTWNPQSGRYE